MRALGQRGRVEVGLTAKLDDAFGKLVGMGLFLAGMLKEMGLDRLGNDPGDSIGMAQIAQHADPFGR
jgi:hypothetical protein